VVSFVVMARRRGARSAGGNAASTEAETAPASNSAASGPTARALYVTGPATLGRYLLPDGIVSLGRDASANIVVDDPRVSRVHAALHLGAEIQISDLDSANGTFLERTRLAPHQPQPLIAGQTFFIGDSALVVRTTPLPRACAKRVRGVDEVSERLDRRAAGGRPSPMLVVTVRGTARTLPPTCESILSPILDGPDDWLMWVGQNQVLVGLDVGADGDAGRVERVVADALLGWRVSAEVSSRFMTRDQLQEEGGIVEALSDTDRSLKLERGPIIFRDPAMIELQRTLMRIAAAPINVLVLGETGAGKDVVASILHEQSPRARKPLVSVNCASLPEALLESELFGYERGAFSGAVVAKPGLLETADGGTVFLDEIGDLALALQAKLLRVLEAHEVTRLGATRPRRLDLRFIAATNRDLPRAVEAGRFRQDLYYRLNTVTVTVPPLRERPTEIEPLARSFAESAAHRFGRPAPELSSAAIATLQEHSWPGNVRELLSAIERAVLLCDGPVVEPRHLPPLQRAPSSPPTAEPSERERIERALAENGWNQGRAAQVLGISRRTLVRKLARLGFPRPRGPASDIQ
jgi:DNA-binding NtrC family response regulator